MEEAVDSRTVIKKLEADGWKHVGTRGDHWYFKHPTKPGKVTVQHPVKDLWIKNITSIEKASGVKLR